MPHNTSGRYPCRAKRCDNDTSGFMCPDHYALIPPAIRSIIEAEPNPRACPTAIATAAIDAVAHKESRYPTKGARRKPGKPVQLALFDLTGPSPDVA